MIPCLRPSQPGALVVGAEAEVDAKALTSRRSAAEVACAEIDRGEVRLCAVAGHNQRAGPVVRQPLGQLSARWCCQCSGRPVHPRMVPVFSRNTGRLAALSRWSEKLQFSASSLGVCCRPFLSSTRWRQAQV